MLDVPLGRNEGGPDLLDAGHLITGLATRTARGGAVMLGAQLAKQAINLGATMVMARALMPSDYGLVGMVTAITGFVSMFRDMGLSMATVQREMVTQDQVSTLFWVNVGAGLLLALVTAALAPLVAWFYGEERLIAITWALAIGFIAYGLAAQHHALLQRQMRFTTLALIDVVVLCVQSAVGVALALTHRGYWALVFHALAGNLALAVALWATCGWRPGRPVRGAGTRSLLAFGRNLVGFNVVNYFARNLDNVLIGRVWGEWQLGLYSRAYNLLLLPMTTINGPIGAVVVPALSRLQRRPKEYKELYLASLSLIAGLTMPAAVLMIVASRELISLVFGPNWVDASVLFQLLGISAVLQPIYNTQGWVHMSLGGTDRMLRWGLVGSTLIVLSFLAGLPFGARGVALSYSLTIVLITWPCLWYAFRGTEIRLRDLLRVITRPLVSSLVAGGAALALTHRMMGNGLLLRTAAVSGAQVSLYVMLYFLLPGWWFLGRRPRIRALLGWMHAAVAGSEQ